MATTTFGYNNTEDRIWVSSTSWKERLWITRRQAQSMVMHLAQTLEQLASGEGDSAARAAREHDASLNRPATPGAPKPLQMGRDTAQKAAEVSYLLCNSMLTITHGNNIDVQLHTPAGVRSIRFDREALHRWLRALYLILQQTEWNLPPAPEWVSRSYLPPALRAILDQPLPDTLGDEEDDDVPPPPPAKG